VTNSKDSHRISVIIPTWNRAHTLERAILSVLTQTYPPFEVLVCDDGSTDNSEQVVKNIGDSRVHWIAGDHAGCPAIPRNRGIGLSKGDLIAFLDSDDSWLPKKLEMQVLALNRSKSLAVCTNAYRDFGQKLQECLLSWNTDHLSFNQLLMDNKVVCSSVLIKKSVFQLTGGFPESKLFIAIEDYALWLKVAHLKDFSYLDLPLVIYKDDPVHSVRSRGASIVVQRIRIFSDYLQWQFSRNIFYALSDSMKMATIFVWLWLRSLTHECFIKFKK